MKDDATVIEKGIPIPPRGEDFPGMPLRKMELGDSFFFQHQRTGRGGVKEEKYADSLFRAKLWNRAKSARVKVRAKRAVENEVEGYRIWRVA
jgi:hypothetical protein